MSEAFAETTAATTTAHTARTVAAVQQLLRTQARSFPSEELARSLDLVTRRFNRFSPTPEQWQSSLLEAVEALVAEEPDLLEGDLEHAPVVLNDQERELYQRLSLRNRKIVWLLTKLAVSLAHLVPSPPTKPSSSTGPLP